MKKMVTAFVVIACVGCQSAIAALAPGIAFTECVWQTYEAEPPGTPIGQVVTDEVAKCGGDAVNVVRVLDDREAPALHQTVAHADKAASTSK
jgi:hypothetical protein